MLINVCNLMQLEKISRTFCENFLVSVKELWRKVHEQILAGSIVDCREEKHYYVSNIRTSDLAESIFRLSINDNRLNEDLPVEKVKGRIFGSAGSSFEDFMVNHWEESPLIIQNLAAHSNHETDIFNSILSPLCSVGSVPSFLSAMLRNLVSCDPIASDELDILDFLKGLRSKMGFPIIYQQDIRVVRTERHLKRETHFFQESFRSSCTVESQYFKVNDILKCEKGYEEGYTIALRGMEFRFKSIAAIADILASLFGQPSVGANMYLTPPCSQGLIRHYDDHCVFVCQMCGSKQWTVYYPPKVGLPRLYDTLDGLHDSEVESKLVVFGQFLLTEGDVLYIPRGFPHEASTHNDDSIGSRTFSLHLTFGVEVEPPFEWEGFAHVALYLWSQNQNHSHPSFESLSGIYHAISVDLLHIAIGLMGISDNIFRKACLAAAISLPSDTDKWLDLNQRTVFRELLDKINKESNFLEVLGIIEVAIRKKEDPFHRLRWLQLLNVEGINRKEHEWNIPSMRIEDFFPFCQKHKDTIEGTFMKVKSSFCSEVSFDTVLECYKILLERYRKVRKQYTRGMISLH